MELRPAEAPIREHVTKFGGRPVWLGAPTWPLTSDDTPMTFLAQFRVPGVTERMAYLFADGHDSVVSEDGNASVVVQPGPEPHRFEHRSAGPAYVSELPGSLSTFKPRMRHGFIESIPTLTEGHDPPSWSAEWVDEQTSDFDWNKVGGTPHFLQGDEWPPGDGWTFVAQFTAALMGFELGDAGECYVFVSDDGRGAFVSQSH